MADLAVVHASSLGADSSGNYTVSFDTTGDTWMTFAIAIWTAVLNNVSVATYNGVSILSSGHKNPATAHFAANLYALYYMNLGANAGNNSFNVQWSGGGELDFSAVSGNGTVDPAVLDAVGWVDTESITASGVWTCPVFTPTTDKTLPLFLGYSQSQAFLSASSNCTLDVRNIRDTSQHFHCPLSSPAGSPTSAVVSDATSVEFVLSTFFGIKPTGGGGGGGTNWGPSMLAETWNRIVQN